MNTAVVVVVAFASMAARIAANPGRPTAALALAILLVAPALVPDHRVLAQAPPAFEVASVRENRSGDTIARYSPGLLAPLGARAEPAPGQISLTNAPLRRVIALAFGVTDNLARWTMAGGPDRILDARFDIVAKPPDGAPPGQALAMLQTLLRERFQLEVHREMRQVPAYAVTRRAADRLGPRLRPSTDDCTSPSMPTHAAERAKAGPKGPDGEPLCPATMYAFGRPTPREITIRYVSPVSHLLDVLQAFIDRPVFDATGLSGSFVWSVTIARPGGLTPSAEPEGLSVFSAFEEQLGLRLEPRMQPMEVLVIDAVEMPTPN
jgi:uncharacterized protein (TIGR03435 family)